MGFFDFFRKKKEPKIEDIVGSIMSQVFPNGKSQIQLIASSLYKEFGGKYPIDSLMKSIAYCGSMLITAHDKSSLRVIERGLLLKPDNSYSKEDAITIYKAVVKSYFSSKIDIDNNEAFDAFYKSLGNVGESVEIINKRIKGATGTYGLSVNNPIPIKGVQASYSFLDKLLTSKGEPIQYKRLGSFNSSVVKELIDGYAITDNLGHSLGTIYICGYCNVEDPEPPTGFIIKGMSIQRQIPKPVIKPAAPTQTIVSKPSSLVKTSQQPTTIRPNVFNLNKTVPTQINPSDIDTIMKRAKRADLWSEMNEIFDNNDICVTYDQEIKIDRIYDIFNNYTKFLQEHPLFESLIKNKQIDYITENIRHFFKLGVAVYLVNNEYGNYVGRWTDDQYGRFLESVKLQSFTMYYDMLESFDTCEKDILKLEKCFSFTAEQFFREYKEECIKEIESISSAAYHTGFKYCLVKFGDEFLRLGLSEKDYGLFKLSQNLCNTLTYAYINNVIKEEEFLYDESVASQVKSVSLIILDYYKEELLDDKKSYGAISNIASVCINAGIDAVLTHNLNYTEVLTVSKIIELSDTKGFRLCRPFLMKFDIVGLECEIINGSHILGLKDNSLKIARAKSLCLDSFLLGMTIALRVNVSNSSIISNVPIESKESDIDVFTSDDEVYENSHISSTDLFIISDRSNYSKIESNMHNSWYEYFHNAKWNEDTCKEILNILPLINIETGYVLDSYLKFNSKTTIEEFKNAISNGSSFFCTWRFYVRRNSANQKFTDDTKPLTCTEDMKIDYLSTKEAINAVPSTINHLQIPFSKEALIQWVYYFNVINNSAGDMILTEEDFENYSPNSSDTIYPEEVYLKLQENEGYLPYIHIEGNIAEIKILGAYNMGCTGGTLYSVYFKIKRWGKSIRIVEYKKNKVADIGRIHLNFSELL